jgi:hypothetical protein
MTWKKSGKCGVRKWTWTELFKTHKIGTVPGKSELMGSLNTYIQLSSSLCSMLHSPLRPSAFWHLKCSLQCEPYQVLAVAGRLTALTNRCGGNVHWGCILRNAKSSHTCIVQSTIVFYFCSLECGVPRGPSHSKQRVLLWHVQASRLRSLFMTATDCQSHDASLQTECAAHNLLPSKLYSYLLLPLSNKNCHLSSFTHCSVMGLDGW